MDILKDEEIRSIIGTIIIDGDAGCIRPNSYILRLGPHGEFLNVQKDYKLGDGKRGIRVQPGHCVAMMAFETVDFRPQTVEKIFPGCGLHGILTPTTDLAREGVVCPTGQVDAGYYGTLNWTVTNTSSEERKYQFKERLVRLTIFKLSAKEKPQKPYDGPYQHQTGYVRSSRAGPAVGIKDSDWADAKSEESPEGLLEMLMKSGYPWHALGTQFKIIDQQFQTVTNEYADIRERVDKMAIDLDAVKTRVDAAPAEIRDTVRKTLQEEATALQNRWILATVAAFGTIGALVAGALSDADVSGFVKHNPWVWVISALICAAAFFMVTRKSKPSG